MKEAWHLAASDGALSAPQIVKLYSKRWTIEPSFRDSKDLRFGMGMSALRIDDPRRRDRLLLLNAFAILLLTLLGAAGESLGMDRLLRTSTVKRRVHSLFRQGCLLYDLIPNMPEARLRPLIERYAELLRQNASFAGAFDLGDQPIVVARRLPATFRNRAQDELYSIDRGQHQRDDASVRRRAVAEPNDQRFRGIGDSLQPL